MQPTPFPEMMLMPARAVGLSLPAGAHLFWGLAMAYLIELA